ncbi:hypothetical protein ACLUUI_06935 [Enterobacterales bacterium AW_CKDN230030176-1A_HGKHYDSX7]
MPLRPSCPAGVCDCGRAFLAQAPGEACRVLLLTRQEEKRLIERLEHLRDFDDLQHMQRRLREQLGIEVRIAPGANEVRSMRGIVIELTPQPGLCRRTRQAVPAAIRRGLERNPEVAFRLLDAHDLLGGLG